MYYVKRLFPLFLCVSACLFVSSANAADATADAATPVATTGVSSDAPTQVKQCPMHKDAAKGTCEREGACAHDCSKEGCDHACTKPCGKAHKDKCHDKGESKCHDKGEGKCHDKGEGKCHDKGEGKCHDKDGQKECGDKRNCPCVASVYLLFNVSTSAVHASGVYVGGYNGAYGDVTGAQIGVLNYANNAKGLQLGLVNYANTMKGVQIGVVNIMKNSKIFPYMPVLNIGF